jgi:integrase/recombinase XerC
MAALAYLKNGGTLEKAAQKANHALTCTTQLYDRRPSTYPLHVFPAHFTRAR